jgi:hypothetical protein
MWYDLLLNWKLIMFVLAALAYILTIKFIEIKGSKKAYISDEEYLHRLARMKECSEYDIFHISGEYWHLSRGVVEEGFKNYLRQGQLPYFVRDFIRRCRLEIGGMPKAQLLFEGNLPALWCE